MKTLFQSTLWVSLLVAAASAACAQNVAVDQRAGRTKAKVDPFVSGAPFTLDQVQRLLAQDAIPIRRRKEAIQNRGVDFAMSAEVVDQLKKSGATDDLLELIETKAKPVSAPAPAPKHHPAGGLIASCEPQECVISLNGTPRGSTDHGVMEFAGLSPGSWVVDFSRDGYIGQQTKVTIEAEKKASISAALEPNRSTHEAYGAALFAKMLEALGGEEGLKQMASVQAMGSTMIVRNGNNVRLSIAMRNRADRALFQARAGATLYEIVFVGNEFMASKNLKGQDAMELPTEFGYVRDHQLAALITRLKDPRYKLVAPRDTLIPGEQFNLFAEAATEKIAIGLDSDLRPQRVRITTETGLGAATVTYSDYFKDGSVAYPKAMQIKPDGRDRGLDVRFDTVELNTAFKDSDYKLRGKPLSNLAN